MKLELHRLNVKGLRFSDKTGISDGILSMNKAELLTLISEDPLLGKNIDVDIALPGDKTRIMSVKDVIEPRCKLEGGGQVFPGMLSDVEKVGEGKTLVLSGCAVVKAGKLVLFQEEIIDMSVVGADYTPYSKTYNVVLVLEPSDPNMDKHDYEKACRLAGLKAAAYLAKSCAEVKSDSVEIYEQANILECMNSFSGLPKVGYLYMLQTQGLLHDTYLYDVDVKRILPTIISPLEVMDSAIVSGNCVSACNKNSTYSHQNNPVIAKMLKRHGKDFNFIACIVTNENVTLEDKRRSSSYATKLAAMLGLEGLVITEEGNIER